MGVFQVAEIDDVQAHFDQDSGQCRVGYIGCDGPHTQNNRGQHHRMDHAGNFGVPARADIHHRAHGGAGTGDATEQARHCIADTLANQLLIGVVSGPGHVIRHQRGEQTVDGPQHSQNKGRFQHQHHGALLKHRHAEAGQSTGDFAQYG